jgi:CRP/FNR family transcriptional regulator, cyclic AMP receptor protein
MPARRHRHRRRGLVVSGGKAQIKGTGTINGMGSYKFKLSAVDGEPLSATGTSLDPLDAVVIPKAEFVNFLEKHPSVVVSLLRTLSRKLRDADRKRIEFGSQDTVSRLASRLLELADRYGETGTDGVRISLQLSQEELAGWLGASREAVSRALRTLRERGWIETGRRSITGGVIGLARSPLSLDRLFSLIASSRLP